MGGGHDVLRDAPGRGRELSVGSWLNPVLVGQQARD